MHRSDLDYASRLLERERRKNLANWDKWFLRTVWPLPVIAALVVGPRGLCVAAALCGPVYILLGVLSLIQQLDLFSGRERV